MLTPHIQSRFSLVTGLFVLTLTVGLLGGCGEQDSPSTTPTPTSETSQPHDGHDHHDDHAHNEASDDTAPASKPADLDADAQTALDQIVANYLSVQQQLAADDMEGVQAQLDELHDAAHALMHVDDPAIVAKARAVAEPVHEEPADLDQARELFKPLSTAVIDLVALASPSDDVTPTLYQAHCPMAEADWLQAEEQLVNPYMGERMLRCGEIKQMVKPASEG
ncbi:MAG: DUF3347 domain-containing protein [Phycisphaeraceae bacterium]